MEELPSSVKTHSQKRKNNFPSINIVTRSKSQINSNCSRSSPNYREPNSSRREPETADTFLELNDLRVSGIKDLRARRVFTTGVDSILEEEKVEEKKEGANLTDGKELLEGSDTCEVLDPGLVPEEEEKEENMNEGKDLSEGSGTGPNAGRIWSSDPITEEEDKEDKVNEGKESLKDSDTCFDASQVLDMDVDLVDLKTDKSEKSDEQNGSGNGFIPKNKLVVSSCRRRKVFSTPSSFGYRRLIPYIMDIVENDSSVSKFEIIDAGNPSKLQKLGGVLGNAEQCSIAENSIAPKVDHFFSYSPLEKEETLMFKNKDKKLQNLSGSENELKLKTENIIQLEVEKESRDNGLINIHACLVPEGEQNEDNINKENDLLEGSDAGRISGLDSILEREEKEDKVNEGKEPMKDSGTCSDASRVLDMDVDKSEKSDEQNGSGNDLNLKDGAISGNESTPRSKTVILCRRKKVFCTPSSFSYRRLLPYLKDIVNNDPSVSKFEMVDAGNPTKLHKLGGVSAEESTIAENCITSKVYHSVPLNKEETRTFENKDEKLQNLSGSENELDQKTEHIRQLEVEQKNRDIGVSSVDASIEEECIQMTPPDADIFSKTEVGHVGETTETNTLINRPVLNPCSRLRVFKNTNSHSYKRLLPFLIDMSKNNSFASRITPSSFEIPQTEDVSSPNSDTNLCSSIPQPSFTNNSSNVEPNLLASERPPILTKQSSSEEQNECLGEVEAHNENDKSASSLQVEVSDSLVIPENGPSKGILKRNPRGCRGPCNCLNCTSFRLHADRAFEFSRNQMYDAEEIASDLMKELATLRFILGKAAASENDSSSIQLNKVEVRQACDKALEIENVAKARLSQMNYDLNIHCRIPPKVTFAKYVQERANPTPVPDERS